MKLSSKGRYAIQAMFDIAYHGDGEAVQVKDICDRQHIPPRFLEQVFQDLRKSGLVRSKRGPKGGYQLAQDSDRISLGDIIRAVQGPLLLVREDESAELQQTTSGRVMQHVLGDVSAKIDACLDGVTLQVMCDEAKERGLVDAIPAAYVYSI